MRALAPRSTHGRNLAVDFAHVQRADAFMFRLLPNGAVGRRRWSDVPDVVLDAHDDDGRLSAAADQETLVLFPSSPQDLSELSARGYGGNTIAYGFCRLFNNDLREPINQFT
jgi:hypothetical protein